MTSERQTNRAAYVWIWLPGVVAGRLGREARGGYSFERDAFWQRGFLHPYCLEDYPTG